MCGEEPISGSVLDNLDSLGLPPATTTGENTFGCLINGEPWLPLKRGIFGSLSYQIDFSWGTVSPGFFSCLMVQDYDSLQSILDFVVLDVFSEGVFSNLNLSEGGGVSDQSSSYEGGYYETDLLYDESEVTINRLDSIEEIISGTFRLRYINENLSEPDTIWITEGRFDLKGS